MAFGDLRASGHVEDATGVVGEYTATLTAAAQAGDLIVACGIVHAATPVPTIRDDVDTAGSSWTKEDQQASGTTTLVRFTKLATGSESSVIWNPGGSTNPSALSTVVLVGPFSALDAPANAHVFGTAITTLGPLSLGHATAQANEVAVGFVATRGTAGGSSGPFTWSGDLTELIDAGQRISIASAVVSTSGTTPTATTTWGTARTAGMMIAAYKGAGTSLTVAANETFPTFGETDIVATGGLAVGAFGTYRQSNSTVANTAGTSNIGAQLVGAALAGNLLIADLRVNDPGAQPLISDNLDTAGTSWELDVDIHQSHTVRRYSKIAVGGEQTFTLNLNGANAARAILVSEFSGPTKAAGSYLDPALTSSSTGTASVLTVTTPPTLVASELVVATVMLHGSGGGTVGSTFTWTGDLSEQYEESNQRVSLASAVVPTIASAVIITCVWTNTTRSSLIVTGYQYVNAVIPPPPPPPPPLLMRTGRVYQ